MFALFRQLNIWYKVPGNGSMYSYFIDIWDGASVYCEVVCDAPTKQMLKKYAKLHGIILDR